MPQRGSEAGLWLTGLNSRFSVKMETDDADNTSAQTSQLNTPEVDSKPASSIEIDSKEPTVEIDSKEATAEPNIKPEIKREEDARADMRAMFDTPSGVSVKILLLIRGYG